MSRERNQPMEEKLNRAVHQDWATGFVIKTQKKYHPYTQKGFFDKHRIKVAQSRMSSLKDSKGETISV